MRFFPERSRRQLTATCGAGGRGRRPIARTDFGGREKLTSYRNQMAGAVGKKFGEYFLRTLALSLASWLSNGSAFAAHLLPDIALRYRREQQPGCGRGKQVQAKKLASPRAGFDIFVFRWAPRVFDPWTHCPSNQRNPSATPLLKRGV
jgi:hypothetical protein